MKITQIFYIYIFITLMVFAQSKTEYKISGIVIDNKTFERLSGVDIYCNEKYCGATDAEGFFKFTTKNKTLSIKTKGLGYKTALLNINLDDAYEKLVIHLQPEPIEMETITISGEKRRAIDKNIFELQNGDIKNIPIFLEADAIRVLQTLPGITTSSDVNSQVYVRGGNFDETGLLIDGVPIYNAYHFGGIYGAINPDIIKKERIFSSNFTPDKDNFLSGIIELETKNGNRNRLKGILSLGLVSSKAYLETPLLGGSFIFSARRTYLDLVSGIFDSNYDFPYYFYDLYGKYTAPIGEKNVVSFSIFYARDNYNIYDGNSRKMLYYNRPLHWKTGFAQINHSISFTKNIILQSNISHSICNQGADAASNYYNKLDSIYINNKFSHTTIKSELQLNYQSTESKVGINWSQYNADYYWNIPLQEIDYFETVDTKNMFFDFSENKYSQKSTKNSFKFYAVSKLEATKKLQIIGGISLVTENYDGGLFFNPTLNINYFLSQKVKLKFAAGRYIQSIYTKRDQIRNSFMTPFSIYFLPKDSRQILKSNHFTAGVNITNLPLQTDLLIELYYKSRSNIPTAIENKKSIIFYDGYAYGADFLLSKKNGEFTGWLAYSFSRSVKNNKIYKFFAGYDRPHSVKILLNYKLSDSWSLSSYWCYGSGLPYTPISGKYLTEKPLDLLDIIPERIISSEKSWELLKGRQNSVRFRANHRLDIGITGKFIWFKKIVAKPYLQILNVYNSKNPYQYLPVSTNKKVKDGEQRGSFILPTIGLILEF